MELASLPMEGVMCLSCGSHIDAGTADTMQWTAAAARRMLGKFELLEIVGSGAFGTVFKARDTELDRIVAIKVPRAGALGSSGEADRFSREARSVAQLRHPSIVSIYEVGQHDGVPYLVSEFVQGQTLDDLLSGERLPVDWTAELVAALADALQYAHERGVVHRDVKPTNIMLERLSSTPSAPYSCPVVPRLMDFGLAKRDAGGEATMTLEGQILGTPAYMSPEQARGEGYKVDGRSDIYSCGVILYQLLTGELPFQGNQARILDGVLHDEPKPPRKIDASIPRDLETICLKAMAKEPDRRYPSAAELAADLRRWMSGEPIHARPVGTAERILKWIRRRPAAAGLIALSFFVLMVGGALGAWFWHYVQRDHLGRVDGNAVEALAILPFENVGGDPQTEPLSDGLADHLINSLSQVGRRDLKVRPFTSVSRYKRQRPDVPTMGRELNVQVILTGTLHQQGDDLSIGVELVDAREDNRLWGKRYQGKRDEILDLQDTIAREVAAKLRIELTGEEEQRLTRRYTHDPEAYLLYREGVYHWKKFSQEGVKTGMEYFQRALKKDPNYALAYAGLGQCYIVLGNLFEGPKNTFPEVKKHLDKALAIDPTLPEAHLQMGVYHLFSWNWAAAERELKHAIEVNPSLAQDFPSPYGLYLGAMGRPAEALDYFQGAQKIDLLSGHASSQLSLGYLWLRQYDRAIVEARKALELDPHFLLAAGDLGLAYSQKGMHKEAVAELNQAVSMAKGTLRARMLGLLGYAYAAAGRKADAGKVLAELKESSTRYGHSFSMARIHAALGEADQAIEWLQRACEEREPGVIWLKVDPTVDNLRTDPRFDDLLMHMGLADKTEKQTSQALAILPFVYTGADPKTQMLSETLAGHVIDCLGQVRRPDLKIRPFSSVARYTRDRPDNLTIGRALNAPLLVTGTIQQREEDLTITVEVVDAREDSLIGSHRYAGKSGEPLALDVQDQIVRDVADNLGLRLSDEEQRRLTRRRTVSREAYNLYREAMYHFEKFTPDGLAAGIDAGKKAIDKDPNFPLAYYAVARCYILRGSLFDGPKKSHPEARAYLDKALKLDPDLPEAHAALGTIHLFKDWNWAEAERELRFALRSVPNVNLNRNILGFCLAALGRLDEALASIERGQELDPLAPARWNEVAMCHNAMGDYDQAIAAAKRRSNWTRTSSWLTASGGQPFPRPTSTRRLSRS
jgi:TolB-like protein/Tfp pilus assembly protein PilF/tRNA A-37 threonylcarbamoyl transferase component Bud32